MKRISSILRFVLIAVVLTIPVSIVSAQTVSWDQTGSEIVGPGAGSEAGKSVAINADGSIVAIGAAKYNSSRGNVRVYQNLSGIWTQIGADITSSIVSDNLGAAVSLSSDGTILAIGAWGKDETLNDNKGFVQIYQYNGTSWNQIGADIYGENSNDQSGTTVSLSSDGSIVAIGSPYYSAEKGTVRVYQNQGGNWTKLGLNIGEAENINGDRAAYWSSLSISSDGKIVAVGAYRSDGNGNDAGRTSIYKYDSDLDTWNKLGNDIYGVAGDQSGLSVSISGDGQRVAVGAYKHTATFADIGCTRVYEYNSLTTIWDQLGNNIIGEGGGDQSGKSVSLSSDGSIVAIGAPLNNGIGANDQGQVRVYKYISGTWSKMGQDIDGKNDLDYNGLGVAINADGTVLAAGNTGTTNGSVNIFTATAAWKGTASNDWSTPENWDVELVPTANISAKISAGLTNYPTLNAAANIKNLTIESTETSTGSIMGQSNLIVNGTTTIKRQMTGNAWHLVASPVPGEDIQSFLTTNTNIPTKSGSRGMMDYDEMVNNWKSFFNASTTGTLEAGKGYSLRTDADGTVQFEGTLQTGSVSPAVASTSAELGWNCIGNPYPSSIFINNPADVTNNFIDLNDANFDPSYKAIYIWEQGNNAYTFVSNLDAAYTAAMGQAFMVKAKTGTTNFQFSTDLQTHAPTAELKNGDVAIPAIKLVAQISNQKSSMLIKFEDGMKAGLDPGYDIGILKSGLDFYSTLIDDNGVDFGMQFLPLTLLENSEIALGLESKESGTVSISALTENLPLGYVIVLEDRLLGTFTELSKPEIYSTDITKSTQGKGRFYLHISNSTTKIGDLTTTYDFNAYYINEKIVIDGSFQGKGRATVFDLMGRKIKELELNRAPVNAISTMGMKNGIYILNIQYDGGLYTKKIPLNR